MTRKNETYIGDGCYASFDGFSVWLRAPRSGGDHEVALEPLMVRDMLLYAINIGAVSRENVDRWLESLT